MEEDNRFKHIATDPKFRRIPKAERKVKVDKRFKSMFKSKQFKIKYTVDKRGRPVNRTSNEDLKRYYELSSGSEDSDADNEVGKYVREPKLDSDEQHEKASNVEEIKKREAEKPDGGKIPNKIKSRLRNLQVDYARGEASLLSESSSDDESSEEENDETANIEHAWGELDHDAESTDEITRRLAVCNMDWDRIKAVDLMVLLSSFLPPGGLIITVAVYPSEFGLKRMQKEEINGPTELTETNGEAENETEEGSKYHMEKLRQYQLNRLKYYYAVVTCDSKNSANKIYSECDGFEFESSATKMDLRFIPDDMKFEHQPKETCEKLPEPGKYQPRFFTTTALQQAKVNLTWDETNPDRIEITQKLASGNIDDVSEGDIQAYLASSSGEEDEENHNSEDEVDDSDPDDKKSCLDKYKQLLEDINTQDNAKKNKDVEMEITWGIDLKDKTEKMVKQKLEGKNITPFQKYLEKRKDKRKQKKEKKQKHNGTESDCSIPSDVDMTDPYFAEEFHSNSKTKKRIIEPIEDPQNNAELELLVLNQQDNKHFNLHKIQQRELNIKSKKNKDVQQDNDDFTVNVDDARFSALYSSHHFNLDPTDPHYKKTKGMDALKNEKLKRRNLEESISNNPDSCHKNNVELNVLVKSIKRKTEALGNNKQKKDSKFKKNK